MSEEEDSQTFPQFQICHYTTVISWLLATAPLWYRDCSPWRRCGIVTARHYTTVVSWPLTTTLL